MVQYKGKLKSKDEELSCECEGHDIERKLSEYHRYMSDCMRGFIPGTIMSRSAADIRKAMQGRFTECAQSYYRRSR